MGRQLSRHLRANDCRGYYFGKKLRRGLGIPVGIITPPWEARKSRSVDPPAGH